MCDRGTCGKTFRHSHELQKHLSLHDNNLEKCYFCPWGAPSGQTSLIRTHLNQHFGQANYSCWLCDRTFYRKNNLDVHFEINHEILKGKYKCSLCDFQTHAKSYLLQHKRHHNLSLPLNK